MRTIVATTPAGTRWRVRVVWQPRWQALAGRFRDWRRRRRGGDGGGFDVPDVGSGDDLLVGIAVLVGLVLFGLVFWFVLLPLLLIVVDILVVVVLLALAVPARVLLRRPWTVEAVSTTRDGRENRFATQVVGWRRAREVRDEIVQKLRDGHPAPVV